MGVRGKMRAGIEVPPLERRHRRNCKRFYRKFACLPQKRPPPMLWLSRTAERFAVCSIGDATMKTRALASLFALAGVILTPLSAHAAGVDEASPSGKGIAGG